MMGISCWLCGRTPEECEIRQQHDGWGSVVPPEYVCEECFKHDLASFDDLPKLED